MKPTRPKKMAVKPAKPTATYLARPDFQSEREEAEWWDTHRDEVDDFIERAHKAGAVTRGAIKRELAAAVRPTTPTSIRLLTEDLELAKVVASRKGLKLQTYIKMVLHEALEREQKVG